MRKIDGFQCEYCDILCDTEKEAEECEVFHKTRRDDAKLMGMSFVSKEGWGKPKRRYPETVNVRFSDDKYDFAQYTLTRIGPKGL